MRLRTAVGDAGGRRWMAPVVALLAVVVGAGVLGTVIGIRGRGQGAPVGGMATPAARSGAAMAFDEGRRVVVMFGGRVGESTIGDTWIWDGSAWSEQHPAHRPAAMLRPLMAYDPQSGRVILFGLPPAPPPDCPSRTGCGASAGACSTAVAAPPPGSPPPSPPPPPPAPPGCVRPVLRPLPETWAWDGHDWTRVRTAHSPDPVGGAQPMATDSFTRRIVLVEPSHEPQPLAEAAGAVDTWTFEGSDWERHATPAASAAPPIFGGLLAFDPSSGRLLLFRPGYPVEPAGPPPGCAPPPAPPASAASPPVAAPCPVPPPQPPIARPCCSDIRALVESWDGDRWTAVRTTAGWRSPATPGAIARDDRTRSVVELDQPGRTWVWSGGAWTLESTPVTPGQRFGAAAAFDAAHGTVVVFGGRLPYRADPGPLQLIPGFPTAAGDQLADDTWTWDGVRWALRGGEPPAPAPTPGAAPPPREPPTAPG